MVDRSRCLRRIAMSGLAGGLAMIPVGLVLRFMLGQSVNVYGELIVIRVAGHLDQIDVVRFDAGRADRRTVGGHVRNRAPGRLGDGALHGATAVRRDRGGSGASRCPRSTSASAT